MMRFHIDGKSYAVVIATRPLLLDGQPCRAKLDRARGRIWLSDQLPRGERRREVMHELRHAWVDARGASRDEEQDARMSAEMMDVVLEQFLHQGGDNALEALEPPRDVKTNKQPAGAISLTESRCGYCEVLTAVGSIATGAPEWMADLSVWVVDRGLLCGVCDRVTCWREVSTGEGMPIGQIVPFPPPRVLAGADAAGWVGEHQELCRVRMV